MMVVRVECCRRQPLLVAVDWGGGGLVGGATMAMGAGGGLHFLR